MSAAGSHSGRVAVVTGGARGFGRAIAGELARRGAEIAVVDLADASETVAGIEAAGGRARAYRADVSDPASVEAAGRRILDHHGRADILVNNAGIIVVRDFFDTDFETWKRVRSVNLDSQFLMARAFAGVMRDNGWGRIVNLASNTLGLAASHLTSYIASKGGVVGLTRGLASDLAPYGITVNAVAPTASRTPGGVQSITEENLRLSAEMQAIKRVGVAADIVGTVCFLTGDDSSFVTGQTIVADGGWVRL
ncbi:SDR family oxidoreductase [Streptomyces sp. NPDC052077]|uniref:SDR family NAD(P)-dependent oxidoreductase n=1 Tax=Streptomyces sp. NPDC052077 TaxID=3154757 RepID=UPI00343E7AE2